MNRNYKDRRWLYCLMPLLLLQWACRKMDKELTIREEESGIVRVLDISENASAIGDGAARLSDTVNIVAKIGLPDAEMKVLLGTRELVIISRQARMDTLISGFTNKIIGIVPVEDIHVRIPADFPIGLTSFSLTVNGLRKPAFSYTIVKPTLLYPGKVAVSGVVVTPQDSRPSTGGNLFYYNPFHLDDGPIGQMTSSAAIDAAVDKNTGVLYFLDQLSSDSSGHENADHNGMVVLRKLEGGVVTTLGGNGTDPNATNIRDKRLSIVSSMKTGPDGMLYMALIDKLPPTPEGAMYYEFVVHAQIARLNP